MCVQVGHDMLVEFGENRPEARFAEAPGDDVNALLLPLQDEDELGLCLHLCFQVASRTTSSG